jgi:hypothetical protein
VILQFLYHIAQPRNPHAVQYIPGAAKYIRRGRSSISLLHMLLLVVHAAVAKRYANG